MEAARKETLENTFTYEAKHQSKITGPTLEVWPTHQASMVV